MLLGFEQANRYTIYDQHGGWGMWASSRAAAVQGWARARVGAWARVRAQGAKHGTVALAAGVGWLSCSPVHLHLSMVCTTRAFLPSPPPGNLVALLAEDEGSIGKAIGRQLLRTRRNFTAAVFSPDGGWAGDARLCPQAGGQAGSGAGSRAGRCAVCVGWMCGKFATLQCKGCVGWKALLHQH